MVRRTKQEMELSYIFNVYISALCNTVHHHGTVTGLSRIQVVGRINGVLCWCMIGIHYSKRLINRPLQHTNNEGYG